MRAEFPYIDESYKSYLLKGYEETYYPERIINSGKAVYIERNYEMIDKSSFCVVYYNENYVFEGTKSGTGMAYEYAKKKQKKIILLQ